MSDAPRRRPWERGAATATGGMPGSDPLETARTVVGELPILPFLPELPERGVGAGMIGRTLALLVDMPVEIAASGWRVADHRSRDERVARDMLARDLDVLDQVAEETGGLAEILKVQAAGPWTLAGGLELRSGHTVLSDRGARRDLAQSLGLGLREHVQEIRRRLPGVRVVLQLDEPSLPTILAGHVPTPSGVGTVAAIEESIAESVLAETLELSGADATAIHCCSQAIPLALLGRSGVDAISLDASLLTTRHVDQLGELVEAGVALWLGVVDYRSPESLRPDDAVRSLLRLWNQLGFPLGTLADVVVPCTACGLAGASPAAAKHALTVLAAVGQELLDPGSPAQS
jgi:methionine synthase II (cobalamin-independent)